MGGAQKGGLAAAKVTAVRTLSKNFSTYKYLRRAIPLLKDETLRVLQIVVSFFCKTASLGCNEPKKTLLRATSGAPATDKIFVKANVDIKYSSRRLKCIF